MCRRFYRLAISGFVLVERSADPALLDWWREMETVEIGLYEELLTLLKRSRLGDRPVQEQVRIALAIQLLQEGVISTGKAASIAGEPRANFELLLAEMGIPALRYDVEDLQRDLEAFERAGNA